MSRIHASASLGLAALALAFVPSPAQTQTCGFPIAAASGSQNFPTVISDGSGGAYVAWVDTRSGESRVYLVRLDTSGQVSPGWPVAGLQVSDAGTEEVAPQLTLDSEGNAYLAWGFHHRNYAQRVMASGFIAPGWPASGLMLANDTNTEDLPQSPHIVPGTHGDAIATWMVDHYGCRTLCEGNDPGSCWTQCTGYSHSEVTGIDSSGRVTWSWTSGGGSPPPVPQATRADASTDGFGGLLLLEWNLSFETLLATRVLASVEVPPGWPRHLKTAFPHPQESRILSAGGGGAFAIWSETSDDVNCIVYVAQVDPSGGIVSGWGLDKRVATVSRAWGVPRIIRNETGGAFASWVDLTAARQRAYILALDTGGNVAPGWPSSGVSLGEAPKDYGAPALVADGVGGVFATWRVGEPGVNSLRFGHVLADGSWSPTFGSGGLAVCSGYVFSEPQLVRLGDRRLLAVWGEGGTLDACCPDVRGAIMEEDAVVATLIASVEAQILDDHATITWHLSDGGGSRYLVERAPDSSGPWTPVESIAAGESGQIDFEDRELAAETTRFYRLRESATTVVLPGSMIDVHGAPARLAIDGPLDGPRGSEIRFHLHVPAGGARLEMFDLTGRKLRAIGVSHSGTMSVGSTHTLASGVYMLRLATVDRAVTTRAFVLH